MQEPTTRGWKTLRGSVFALLASALAALGHVVGGGALPDPVILLTVTVFVGGSAASLATRRRTWPQIFAVLAASQLLFHAAFAVTAHHSDPVDAGRMTIFHVVAAIIATCALASVENTLFRWFSALRRGFTLATPAPAIALAPPWTAVITGGAQSLRLRCDGWAGLRRRGPPDGT